MTKDRSGPAISKTALLGKKTLTDSVAKNMDKCTNHVQVEEKMAKKIR